VLLLAAAADVSVTAGLGARLRAESERIQHRLGDRVSVCVTEVPQHGTDTSDADGFAYVQERGLSNGVRLRGFGAVLDIDLADTSVHEVVSVLDGAAGRLGTSVDADASAVVAGCTFTFVEGDGELQLFYCMRRLPSVTHARFGEY
jgi:hypothetical protein